MIALRPRLFFFLLLGIILINACKSSTKNIYSNLSNGNIGWQEVGEQIPGGSTSPGNLRKYYFFRDGSFQVVCEASDASCLVSNNNTGSWDYISATRIQVTITNGPILFYDILQLDPNNLWFQDANTKNKVVIRQCVPAK